MHSKSDPQTRFQISLDLQIASENSECLLQETCNYQQFEGIEYEWGREIANLSNN